MDEGAELVPPLPWVDPPDELVEPGWLWNCDSGQMSFMVSWTALLKNPSMANIQWGFFWAMRDRNLSLTAS